MGRHPPRSRRGGKDGEGGETSSWGKARRLPGGRRGQRGLTAFRQVARRGQNKKAKTQREGGKERALINGPCAPGPISPRGLFAPSPPRHSSNAPDLRYFCMCAMGLAAPSHGSSQAPQAHRHEKTAQRIVWRTAPLMKAPMNLSSPNECMY